MLVRSTMRDDVSDYITLRLSTSGRAPTPELFCPFRPLIHPDVDPIHEQSVAWARSVGLVRTDLQARRLSDSKLGWLVSRAFPGARPSALQIAADWTTLFCMLDDRIENISSSRQVAASLTGLLDAFRGGPVRFEGDFASHALQDLRRRMLEQSSPGWIDGFSEQLERLMACFIMEAVDREEDVIPELPAYLEMREVSVGLYMQFELFELTDGIKLPLEVHRHPVVASLKKKACNLVGWANDIFTYEKEITHRELHNLLLVLIQAEGMSIEAALDKAVMLHDEEMHAFIRLASDLPLLGSDGDAALQRYIAMLCTWIRGHIDWGHETGRYVTVHGGPMSSRDWDPLVFVSIESSR